MTKEETRKSMLLYGDMLRGNGEIYSETRNGKTRFYMSVEISEEIAKDYVNNPEKFIAAISGSKEEWERERKTL